MTEQMSLDEERMVGEGGSEVEELTPEEVEEKERARTGGETTATPTELRQGAGGTSVPGGAAAEGAPAGNAPA